MYNDFEAKVHDFGWTTQYWLLTWDIIFRNEKSGYININHKMNVIIVVLLTYIVSVYGDDGKYKTFLQTACFFPSQY